MSEKKWYVYLLCDPDTEEPFYVGKGTGARMYIHERLRTSEHNERKVQIIKDIHAAGKEVLKKKIAEFDNEQDAYIYEWGTMWAYINQIVNVNACGLGRRSFTKIAKRESSVKKAWVEKLWTTQELAEYLDISPEDAMKAGLPYCRLGRKTSDIRFRPEKVRAWVEAQEITEPVAR